MRPVTLAETWASDTFCVIGPCHGVHIGESVLVFPPPNLNAHGVVFPPSQLPMPFRVAEVRVMSDAGVALPLQPTRTITETIAMTTSPQRRRGGRRGNGTGSALTSASAE